MDVLLVFRQIQHLFGCDCTPDSNTLALAASCNQQTVIADIHATVLNRAWRKIDLKLSIDGELHILRWRRGWFVDEVLFDDRRVATSQGLVAREAFFGFDINTLYPHCLGQEMPLIDLGLEFTIYHVFKEI